MNYNTNNRSWLKPTILALASIIVFSGNLFAAGKPVAPSIENPLAITLVVIMVGLLIVIGLLSYVVIGAARFYYERQRKEKNEQSLLSKVFTVLVFCLLSPNLFAQADAEAAAPPVATTVNGLSQSVFYTLVGVIGVEVLIILVLVMFLRTFVLKEKAAAVPVPGEIPEVSWKKWWNKINSFRPMREEADIMLDHNYDGIKELDNRLPPWWLYGFYATMIFGVIYLWRFQVAHSAPSSIEEYEASVAKANIEKEKYLKSAANKVDENTVVLLTDDASLADAKKIFTSNCVACHGAEGGGGVGPNLTDDYWLHKGDVKDVFRTIKYGVPEKGMKSWKDDFSPMQIAELASYIKSLHGTKPSSPKEPQGELWTATASAPADSTSAATTDTK